MSMTAYDTRVSLTQVYRAAQRRQQEEEQAGRDGRKRGDARSRSRSHAGSPRRSPNPPARDTARIRRIRPTHARRAKGNPVPIPEPGSGTAYNSGPRKSVRRGNPK